jgi:hypothetical protein
MGERHGVMLEIADSLVDVNALEIGQPFSNRFERLFGRFGFTVHVPCLMRLRDYEVIHLLTFLFVPQAGHRFQRSRGRTERS